MIFINKQRALKILMILICKEEGRLSAEGLSGEKLHNTLLAEFGMTEEEYSYVWRYNGEVEMQKNLLHSLGGAEFIVDEEEEDE